MAVATIEVASSVFVQIMGTSLKNCWSGSFWSFLVTSPRLILRSGYRDVQRLQIASVEAAEYGIRKCRVSADERNRPIFSS